MKQHNKVHIIQKGKRKRTVRINDNSLPTSANYAASWCDNSNQVIGLMKPRYMVITLQLQYVMQTKPAKQLGLTLYDRLGLNHYVISVSNQRSNSWYSDTEKTWYKFHLTRKIPQSLNRANSDIR